jgi:hypothetical protein
MQIIENRNLDKTGEFYKTLKQRKKPNRLGRISKDISELETNQTLPSNHCKSTIPDKQGKQKCKPKDKVSRSVKLSTCPARLIEIYKGRETT